MNPTYRATGKTHILYDAERVGKVDDAFFEPFRWQARGALTGQAPGRGTTFFVRDGEREYVLRHYRRGGLAARVSRDHYLWTGLAHTRPWREWHLLAALFQRGLPVPRPVAVRVVRGGLFYRADIVTERLPARSMASRLREGVLAESLWRGIGACIRRFHDAGVYHADLNAHNILLDDQDRVFIIDFDRGRFRTPGRWQEANLQRLLRSLRKLSQLHLDFTFDEKQWPLLLQGYGGSRGQ